MRKRLSLTIPEECFIYIEEKGLSPSKVMQTSLYKLMEQDGVANRFHEFAVKLAQVKQDIQDYLSEQQDKYKYDMGETVLFLMRDEFTYQLQNFDFVDKFKELYDKERQHPHTVILPGCQGEEDMFYAFLKREER